MRSTLIGHISTGSQVTERSSGAGTAPCPVRAGGRQWGRGEAGPAPAVTACHARRHPASLIYTRDRGKNTACCWKKPSLETSAEGPKDQDHPASGTPCEPGCRAPAVQGRGCSLLQAGHQATQASRAHPAPFCTTRNAELSPVRHRSNSALLLQHPAPADHSRSSTRGTTAELPGPHQHQTRQHFVFHTIPLR